ncbi:hypothetical protein AWC38_SpisGene13810 [Stylophora pistillata]|uniref:Uncharacterized protein n=1 Tax=Stylophora pistillata TaxID=50429 RepID=A0A2B4RX05_STYPI|nr:hypothetical protein AWC38_SpisGene13810 [Stylophora pistillata]
MFLRPERKKNSVGCLEREMAFMLEDSKIVRKAFDYSKNEGENLEIFTDDAVQRLLKKVEDELLEGTSKEEAVKQFLDEINERIQNTMILKRDITGALLAYAGEAIAQRVMTGGAWATACPVGAIGGYAEIENFFSPEKMAPTRDEFSGFNLSAAFGLDKLANEKSDVNAAKKGAGEENSNKKRRFAKMNEQDLDNLVQNFQAASSRKVTQWALSVHTGW